jgi:tetratricopeptide (TPR) repeat protein
LLKRTVQLDPKFSDAYNNLGGVLTSIGQAEEAITCFTKALTIDPGNINAINNLGNAYQSIGNLTEAIKMYQKAIRLHPDLAHVHNNLGNAYQELRKPDLASKSYLKAISINPRYVEPIYNQAKLFQESDDIHQAIKWYKKTLSMKPDHAGAHNNFGVVLQKQGHVEAALESFQKALTIHPKYGEAYFNMGTLLKDLGRFELAIAAYRKALLYKPSYIPALYYLSTTLQEIRQMEACISVSKALLSKVPDHFESHILLAICFWIKGNWESCLSHIRATGSYNPASGDKKRRVFIQAYRLFLSKLLEFRAQNKFVYNTCQDAEPIYLIGDSHCLSYSHLNVILKGKCYRTKTRLVIGCKAWHLANKKANKYKRQLALIVNALPPLSRAVIIFGEIDCRYDEGIVEYHRKTGDDLETSIDELIQNYMAYIWALMSKKKIEPIFFGVPAPGFDKTNLGSKEKLSLNTMVKIFNLCLKRRCQKNGLLCLDPYGLTMNEYGENDGKYQIDGNHLKPIALQLMMDKS